MNRPFGTRDKIGYMFGDIGNDCTFIFASSYFMVFYTKVMGVSAAAVGTLFLVARFIDAFTDVTMGSIVDRIRPARDGRFKCWIRRMAIPVALASFLMYQMALVNAPMWLKYVYMYVTYILWGSVFYTSINIPYGSMASAITEDPVNRTKLSTFRGIGATMAGLVIGTVVPQLIYVTGENGVQTVDGGRMMVLAGIFAILALICYAIFYFNTTERVELRKNEDKPQVSFTEGLKKILNNRAMLCVIAASIFLMLSQLIIQSLNNYLYTDYFRDKNALSMFSLVNSLVGILVVSPLVSPISKRFGKKESVSVVTGISAAIYFILFLVKIKNQWLYLLLTILGFLGVNYFNMVIWAMITDVIDDIQVNFNDREDGTVYAVYSFARKVGQALAGGAGGFALKAIGYDELALQQSDRVLSGLYSVVNIVPAISFLVVALVFGMIYPLSREKVLDNTNILEMRR